VLFLSDAFREPVAAGSSIPQLAGSWLSGILRCLGGAADAAVPRCSKQCAGAVALRDHAQRPFMKGMQFALQRWQRLASDVFAGRPTSAAAR